MYACNGILFNHESPRRGETFVSRKISMAAARIALGLQEKLYLGNLNAKRDWGHAKDYVEAMWLMLQQDQAEDFVIATGKTHSVRDFAQLCFKELGIELEFSGEGRAEVARISKVLRPELKVKPGQEVIAVDPDYFRPTEVDLLIGDATQARTKLKWQPKYDFQTLVKEMAWADFELFKSHPR